MNVNSFLINVTSTQPERLTAFYRDTVGLPKHPDIPEDGAFLAGPTGFVIDGHSDVPAAASEPQRVLLNFMVRDLASEQSRLEGAGVRFIRSAGKEEWGGVISTFLDPDGNYCQLIQVGG